MPGNASSDTTEQDSSLFYYDEGLSPRIGHFLAEIGYSLEVGAKGLLDEDIIPEMGKRGQTWITKDDRAKVQHEAAIIDAGISIVFLRGLSHGGGKKSSKSKNTIRLKELLLLLVTKLDAIQKEIASSNKPRYFILYLKGPNKPDVSKHSTLKEVSQSLSGSA